MHNIYSVTPPPSEYNTRLLPVQGRERLALLGYGIQALHLLTQMLFKPCLQLVQLGHCPLLFLQRRAIRLCNFCTSFRRDLSIVFSEPVESWVPLLFFLRVLFTREVVAIWGRELPSTVHPERDTKIRRGRLVISHGGSVVGSLVMVSASESLSTVGLVWGKFANRACRLSVEVLWGSMRFLNSE